MPRCLLRRACAAVVFAVALGILPTASHALPLSSGSEPPTALRLEPRSWLSHLERTFDSFWRWAATGMSIDPDGQPSSQPGDGLSTGVDTGMSIDPNG